MKSSPSLKNILFYLKILHTAVVKWHFLSNLITYLRRLSINDFAIKQTASSYLGATYRSKKKSKQFLYVFKPLEDQYRKAKIQFQVQHSLYNPVFVVCFFQQNRFIHFAIEIQFFSLHGDRVKTAEYSKPAIVCVGICIDI